VARGRVWSGSQAAERGLVDRVGSLQDAVDAAARIAGLGPDYRVDWYEAEVSPIEEFMLGLTSGALAQLQIGSANLSALSWTRQGFVQQLLQDIQRISRNEGQLTIAAHCMCSVR
jgi:protease-4